MFRPPLQTRFVLEMNFPAFFRAADLFFVCCRKLFAANDADYGSGLCPVSEFVLLAIVCYATFTSTGELVGAV